MSVCVKIFSSVTVYKLFVFSFAASFSDVIFETELFIHDLMTIFLSYICCIIWGSRLQGEILLKPASALVQFVKQDLFSQHKHIMQLLVPKPSIFFFNDPSVCACVWRKGFSPNLHPATATTTLHSPLSTASLCTCLLPYAPFCVHRKHHRYQWQQVRWWKTPAIADSWLYSVKNEF